MNFSLFRKFAQSPSLLLTLAGFATLALTSCASTDTWFKQADSPLPIEVRHSGRGQIMSFRAHETSDRFYVSGSAQNHHLSNPAHVDIQLITSAGTVVAEKQDDIDPRSPRSGGGKRSSDSYVASFPLSEARQAARIRVIYHSASHQ